MEEKQKLLMSSGGLKLPIGYRFRPTDEELVVHYLKRKVFSIPLPALVIPDFDVFQTDPWTLPGEVKEKRYFFHKQKRDVNIMSKKRVNAGSGYWKPIGKERLIVASELNNQPVGIRKTMVFCGGNRPDNHHHHNHRWLMHEFHLVRPGPTPNSVHLISSMELKECWVVCGVFQKKRRPKKKNGTNSERKHIMMTEVTRPKCSVGPPTPSLSSCSGITEVSTLINGAIDYDYDDDQEESSSKINISHSDDNKP
ncbi:NAC domain-containing protein 68 [Morus notabilis]|uniref:NAC domain-containing protein 68 n=1 Tax=Morus notabilis TaxID=981085 RepID=W9S6J5_9ROSA|nr:NAC domain-containing protein 83 [Morus notabilis]EXC29158.1 NAC domain-containing protein 68 [Morus notabilis]